MFVVSQFLALVASLSPYLMPHPRRLVFPIAALAGTLLLHACSQAWPDSFTDSALAGAPAPAPTKRTSGTAADSLDGIPGHPFGEPLRNFPGLVLLDKDDETGVRGYLMPADQQRVWFGEHADPFTTYYRFQDGRFSMFCVLATGLEGSPTAMREELFSLFGPGKDPLDLKGRVDWEGKRVRVQVRYAKNPLPPGTCWLEVHSKPLLAVQQAKRRAQVQALVARSHL